MLEKEEQKENEINKGRLCLVQQQKEGKQLRLQQEQEKRKTLNQQQQHEQREGEKRRLHEIEIKKYNISIANAKITTERKLKKFEIEERMKTEVQLQQEKHRHEIEMQRSQHRHEKEMQDKCNEGKQLELKTQEKQKTSIG